MGEKSPPNENHQNQPENDDFSKSSFSELGQDFPSKIFLLDKWTLEVTFNMIFGPAEDFYWTGGGFMLSRFFQPPHRWPEKPTSREANKLWRRKTI